MSGRIGKSRWIICLAAASAVLGGVALWLGRQPSRSSADNPFPLPPYSTSRHLNTGPNARFIGAAACAECHKEQHRSYLLTAHSRALSGLDPNAEPPDGAFDHKASGRSYRVYRQGKQLRHAEVLRTAEGKEIGRIDLPLRYLVGSGNFSRTYLAEVDGFLHESPITWYASKKQWDMSPGYNDAEHLSFERFVGVSCLFCHAGRVEETGGPMHRVNIHEQAIGCENCHGPGSLHQEFHRSKTLEPGEEDLTIVHPAKLSRPLQEDICAACHQTETAMVSVRGREVTDFRPGMPLSDCRIHYKFQTGNKKMTVVGHIEQMRQSVCYQKSELTCLTCHDPHQRSRPRDSTAFYRQKCLNCHAPQSCALEQTQRLKKDPADNCMACHMPRGDTDIPHIAFTHHRIGRHSPEPPSAPDSIPELVPASSVTSLGPADRERNLGLAYLALTRDAKYSQFTEVFQQRAWQHLEAVHTAGLRDGMTCLGLAELSRRAKSAQTTRYAREALESAAASAHVRTGSLMLLAECAAEDEDYESASRYLEELVQLRRQGQDWRILGVVYLMQKRQAKAIAAFEKALEMRPFDHAVHAGLEEAYKRQGDHKRANEHREKAQWLFRHRRE